MRQFTRLNGRTRMVLRAWRERTVREKQFLIGEFAHAAGLMPLLMKRRNKQRWTAEDRAQLARHMQRLSQLTPYLAVFVLPGGLLMLPVLAWWLDRRRNGGRPGATIQR